MKYPIYSYRDAKVSFGFPQVDVNDQSAIRGFSFAINGRDGLMGFSPNDFDLYKIGIFDNEKGVIEPILPELVMSGSSVVGSKNV